MTNGGWGPQATGGVTLVQKKRGGLYWPFYAVTCAVLAIPLAVAGGPVIKPALIVTTIIGAVIGFVDGKKRADFAHGRIVSMIVVALFNTLSLIGYAVGYGVGKSAGDSSARKLAAHTDTSTSHHRIVVAEDPYRQVMAEAANVWGKAGGHVGWYEGRYVVANPRGGVLVIGPPGSGKSSAVIIPSVATAPGACVSASIKGDVMEATAAIRSIRGKVWHFDPGGAEQPMQGVISVRWSPLVSIRSWDDARMIATRMAAPAMDKGKGEGGNDDHFMERGRDWIEVLLYAAHLFEHDISTVARWAQNPVDEAVEAEVDAALEWAESHGDQGASIARGQHRSLQNTPERERGSIISSIAKLMRIYGSMTARQIGTNPNFDPHAFVRSSDTLYITASPERQKEYAPLLAGLLEEIRYATYQRHKAEEAGAEPKRPHVTFVLDEANNTAPIPLPAIISEAGGQSLHVIVGIQDLSRARQRWGREAEGFLTLFPTKIILNGVVEPYTLDALSNAAGEFDRVMTGYSESTSYVGQYNIRVRQQNPNYSVQRQKVLHQGDIANLPPGKALLFEGAKWFLVDIGMHWQDQVWQRVLAWPHHYYQHIASPVSSALPAAQAPTIAIETPTLTKNGDAS
ncbi:type IV secretory system conjugative DNA transfer family protein [Rhodococcus qingshengii]